MNYWTSSRSWRILPALKSGTWVWSSMLHYSSEETARHIPTFVIFDKRNLPFALWSDCTVNLCNKHHPVQIHQNLGLNSAIEKEHSHFVQKKRHVQWGIGHVSSWSTEFWTGKGVIARSPLANNYLLQFILFLFPSDIVDT
jgi:hypothetical protein